MASCPSWGLTAAYNLAFDPDYDDGGALPSDARLREACSSTRRQCEDGRVSGAGQQSLAIASAALAPDIAHVGFTAAVF